MSNLWVALKRNRVYADIYYKGEKICTLKVNEANRTMNSVVTICGDVSFKIVKDNQSQQIVDDDFFNKESYNK